MEDMEKKTFVMTDKQYNHGACLNEYKGKISICNADLTDSGDVYMQWAYPQYNNKPNEKCLPWAIRLGDVPSAITLLKSMIVQLEKLGREGEPEAVKPSTDTQGEAKRQEGLTAQEPRRTTLPEPPAGYSTPPPGVDEDIPF